MIFADRADAGERLAEALAELAGPRRRRPGDPAGRRDRRRGRWRARSALRSTSSFPRKIGAPGNPELGIGAVAPGVRVLDPRMIERSA